MFGSKRFKTQRITCRNNHYLKVHINLQKAIKNELFLLGTKGGPAIRPKGSMPSSSLLVLDNEKILIDAGLGVAKSLTEIGFHLSELSNIFITHLHSDHYLELGPLIHTAWTTGLTKKIKIYGPKGLIDYWQKFLLSMQYDIKNRIKNEGRIPLKRIVKIIPVKKKFLKVGKIKVKFLQVPHPPLKECYAYKFIGSKKIVFSGDTRYFEPLASFSKKSDVLVHEAILPKYIDKIVKNTGLSLKLKKHLESSHTKLEEVIKIAKLSNCKKLIINHLIPNDNTLKQRRVWQKNINNKINTKVIIGQDKLRIKLS